MDTTFDIIRRLAVDTLEVPEVALLRARTLREAGVDSLATLDLLSAIEAHFGIHITAEDLAELNAALAVVVSGYDVVAAQTILGRRAYEHDEIRFGHRYADIIGTSEDGRLRIDYGRFHETLEG